MINHTRTLLLNVKGEHLERTDIPGDVYIPAYTPIELNSSLQSVYTLLFGTAYDYEGLIYRVSQYMGLLHATEYSPYITAVDSRLTYDADGLTVMSEGLFATVIVGHGLKVVGTWDQAGADGRSINQWTVKALTSGTVKVTNLVSGRSTVYTTGDVKYLIGSDLRLTFDRQPYTPNSEWFVGVRSRPLYSLGEILASIRVLPLSTIEEVFGDTSVEPNKTFYNLYSKHYALPYQLSGFLLAYVNKLEGIRTHVN